MSRRKRCCGVVKSLYAAASVSAAMTCTATMSHGSCRDLLGLEFAAIEAGGDFEHVGREVGGEGKGQSERRGEARAVIAGAKKRDGNVAVASGKCLDDLVGAFGSEIGAQLFEQFREFVARLTEVPRRSARMV